LHPNTWQALLAGGRIIDGAHFFRCNGSLIRCELPEKQELPALATKDFKE
jgi:hypothetical protein